MNGLRNKKKKCDEILTSFRADFRITYPFFVL